jgi:hypothetical protein
LLLIRLSRLRHLHLILLKWHAGLSLSNRIVALREEVVRKIVGYLLGVEVVLLYMCCDSSFLNHSASKLHTLGYLGAVSLYLSRLKRTVDVLLLKTLLLVSACHVVLILSQR